jgi:hypothetical protein
MKRLLAVTFGGVAFTLLVIALGTGAVLSHNPAWRAVVAGLPNSNESFDAWLMHFDKMIPTVIGLVYIPTALLVGFLVGIFSRRHRMSCAIVASCPAWAPLLFIAPKTAFVSVVIAGVAVLGAWLSKWVSPRIHLGPQDNITS